MPERETGVTEVQPAGAYEMSVRQVQAQVAKIQECMKSLMKEGEHYGHSFPGDTKKNLLKPGADKLCLMFRLRPDFAQDIKELDGGHREVMTRCSVYHIDTGTKIADGVGLCSTRESKYRWRNGGRVCPDCGKETLIKGKAEYGGGWVCFTKRGGCGAKFKDNDPAVLSQAAGKVENPDIADTYNTVLKTSKKRAFVDAVITACAASDIFTQDAEDFKTREEGSAADDTPANRGNTDGRNYAEVAASIKNLLNTKGSDGKNVFSNDAYNKEMAGISRIPRTAGGLAALKKKEAELQITVEENIQDVSDMPPADAEFF